MRNNKPIYRILFRAYPGRVMAVFFLPFLLSCTPKYKVVEETFPNGAPRRECEYKGKGEKRILLGESFYYANGKVEMTGGHKDGERDGRWVYYYENGNVWSEGSFKKGKNDGKRLTYYENGKLRYEAQYRNGERTGIWKFYDQAGNLIKEVDYSKPSSDDPDPDSTE